MWVGGWVRRRSPGCRPPPPPPHGNALFLILSRGLPNPHAPSSAEVVQDLPEVQRFGGTATEPPHSGGSERSASSPCVPHASGAARGPSVQSQGAQPSTPSPRCVCPWFHGTTRLSNPPAVEGGTGKNGWSVTRQTVGWREPSVGSHSQRRLRSIGGAPPRGGGGGGPSWRWKFSTPPEFSGIFFLPFEFALWSGGRAAPCVREGPNPSNLGNPPRAALRHL